MRTIWVVILAILALGLGFAGGAGWRATATSLAGFRVACELIQTAERSGAMTRAQIDDSINRLAKRFDEKGKAGKAEGAGDMEELAKQLREGCKVLAPAQKQ